MDIAFCSILLELNTALKNKVYLKEKKVNTQKWFWKYLNMVMEEDLTFGDGHTMHYTDDVSYNCILETYIILLTNVTQ